jgi:hypothetical protein
LVKHTQLMNLREVEIAKIIRILSDQTNGFENPKMVLIGGYALRAFTSFSRYTRDCDLSSRRRPVGIWTGFKNCYPRI